MNRSNLTDKQQTLRELLIYSVLQLVCAGLMIGVFALLKQLNGEVLLGAAVGVALAVVNYFLMAVGVYAAAGKAEQGDPKAGQRIISLSMLGRYGLMILVLVAFAKSGVCNVIAMVIPLALSRILIFVGEFFRRKDG